jgi:predicted pyridoxine 5'-phosphate oxidase superfamily flavin-nucleotide-binding protein
VHLFLIDYGHQRRVKIWGEATVVEDDPELLAKLTDTSYDGKPERAIVIRIAAWDANCPQHIPQRFDAAEVAAALAARDARIAVLEARLEELGAVDTLDGIERKHRYVRGRSASTS